MEAAMEHAGTGRMPALFIGHGSPMNMVLSNPFTRSLAALGPALPRPDAIMVISAHWLTHGTFVHCTDSPRMIYDFFGFPRELYRVKYECRGAPSCANQVTELGEGGTIRCDSSWGLDHVSYSILRHMFPAADIPVFEMSLDYSFNDWHPKPVGYHYELGRRLRALRDMGVLVIGSGNMVHNLDLIDFSDMDAPPL
jgi:4,5-DOPA dioxygenase extradiol